MSVMFFVFSLIAIQLITLSRVVTPLRYVAPGKISLTTPHPPASTTESDNLPKITLLDSTSGYGEPGYVDGSTPLLFQNETVYVVPSSRNSMIFQCEARYPVFWNLLHSNIHPSVYNALRVLSIRQFEDPFDPSTFSYVTILSMNGPNVKLTGNYSCQSSAMNEIQSNIYVYWESHYGHAFIHSKENMTLTTSASGDGNGAEVVTLPCQVTDPDAKPKLKKETGPAHQYDDISANESVHYSPSVGYTLQNLGNPVGIYKCELDGNDFVSIRVVQRNESEISSKKGNGDTPEKRYTFHYDKSMKQVKCCSTGGTGKKPPKIYMILCEHPSTCALRGYQGTEWGKYLWNQGRQRGNCAVLNLKSYHTGIVRCVGNGFNVYREFIVPLRDHEDWMHPSITNTTTVYLRWEEIEPQEMIRVVNRGVQNVYWDAQGKAVPASPNANTIYTGEYVNLVCETSRYYFAGGAYWMFRWKNQTLSPAAQSDNRLILKQSMLNEYYYGHTRKHSNEVTFVANAGLESVLCMAPVWNSSLWVTKIHYLYVNETMSPTISDSKEIVEYTWYTNETNKELSCTARGDPAPTFAWSKDNLTILTSSHNYDMFHSNASKKVDTSTGSPPTTTEPDSIDSDNGDGDDDQLKQNNGNYSEARNETGRGKGLTTSSTLRIARVSYGTSGVFRCVATNFGGSVVKEFHVTVMEKSSWQATGVLVGATLASILLIIGITYLIRKLHKDRQEINQLTRGTVNFSDVLTGSVTSATVNNSSTGGPMSSSPARGMSTEPTFDNGRMTNLLIDPY